MADGRGVVEGRAVGNGAAVGGNGIAVAGTGVAGAGTVKVGGAWVGTGCGLGGTGEGEAEMGAGAVTVGIENVGMPLRPGKSEQLLMTNRLMTARAGQRKSIRRRIRVTPFT